MKSKLLVLSIALAAGLAGASARDKEAASPPLKVHPKIFSLVVGWLYDSASPVVTEINLDVVEVSTNQFSKDGWREEDGWWRCPGPDGGFWRYRVIESRGQRYTVEFQENGGGTFTLATIIECAIEKREIREDGKAAIVRMLRVYSVKTK